MRKKTALITGISGQDGLYLAKLLLGKGYRIYGLVLENTKKNRQNTDYLGITKNINFVQWNIAKEAGLNKLIKNIKPDELYNFAAQSFVASSWDKPKFTTQINSLGVLNILEAIKNFSPHTKFYQASTSEMFGGSHLNGVQVENTTFYPKSPYAVTKTYAYFMTNVYT